MNTIDKNEYKYILRHTAKNGKNPRGYFYLSYKVHKERKIPGKTPSQPICSYIGSVANPIYEWADTMLQPIPQ